MAQRRKQRTCGHKYRYIDQGPDAPNDLNKHLALLRNGAPKGAPFLFGDKNSIGELGIVLQVTCEVFDHPGEINTAVAVSIHFCVNFAA
jgi:hypothetical protein